MPDHAVPPDSPALDQPTTDDRALIDHAIRLGMAWRFLRRAQGAIALDATAWCSEPGLEAGDVDTLDQIALANDRGLMSDIAQGLQVDRSTATRAVDRLEARHLVQRHKDVEDARMIRVSLTEAGRRVQAEVSQRRVEFGMRLLERFDPADREVVTRLALSLADAVADELGLANEGIAAPSLGRDETPVP